MSIILEKILDSSYTHGDEVSTPTDPKLMPSAREWSSVNYLKAAIWDEVRGVQGEWLLTVHKNLMVNDTSGNLEIWYRPKRNQQIRMKINLTPKLKNYTDCQGLNTSF